MDVVGIVDCRVADVVVGLEQRSMSDWFATMLSLELVALITQVRELVV